MQSSVDDQTTNEGVGKIETRQTSRETKQKRRIASSVVPDAPSRHTENRFGSLILSFATSLNAFQLVCKIWCRKFFPSDFEFPHKFFLATIRYCANSNKHTRTHHASRTYSRPPHSRFALTEKNLSLPENSQQFSRISQGFPIPLLM